MIRLLFYLVDLNAELHLLILGWHWLHLAVLADLVALDGSRLALAALHQSWLLFADSIIW